MFDRTIFAARLKALRKKHNLTQQAIAELLEITTTQAGDMERCKSTTTLDKLVKLCEYYHVSADYLLGITDDPTWRGPEEDS